MNIQETEVWQDGIIYLIDINDPVQGGENGVDNLPHKQLANRTKFLKKQVDEQEIKINELQNTIQGLKNTDNSGLQSQIDVLKLQIAEMTSNNNQNNSTKIPVSAFSITLGTTYSDNDTPKPWGMKVSAQTIFGGFVPMVNGNGSLGYHSVAVTIPDWITNSSQVLLTISNKQVNNPEEYIILDIDNHRININATRPTGGNDTMHPVGQINVTLYG